ncbi:endonuclease/exonuclease/phosphatase family protein [Streptomyces sp. NBRC 110028]|uniref:endonuclease/exonuclease/phosphatase family protein n=1 Tax=Streptomyces sp. NBRC 110028 TaxID=1621260 RepID=UPI0006E2841A|nr:endonuclease/exonuclease/phosphatase family protein [Streptomyces sp. NBRC 110028]
MPATGVGGSDNNPLLPPADRQGVLPDGPPDGPPDRPPTGRRRTATRLLVAATAAWTVFLVLLVLLAGRWWPWNIVQLIPPLTLVVVPLLLLCLVPLPARPVRRRLSIALVVLLLAGGHLAGYGPGWGTATASPAGTPVKVFAWSTRFWQMGDDKDAFYDFLRRQDSDVYLLQEYLYWKDDKPVRIDDSARLRAEFPGYRVSVEGELITLSRLPVVTAHHRRAAGGEDAWYWKGTKFQRTDIRVGGRTVSFYNVHLPVPVHPGNPLKVSTYREHRNRGIWWTRELRKLRADLAGNRHPSLVAGDFNSPWMELSSLGAGTQLHSPTGSWLPVRTWPISGFALPRLWRLDWLFTHHGLAVSSDRFDDGGEDFSDHAGQEIRVVVPDEAGSAQPTHTP